MGIKEKLVKLLDAFPVQMEWHDTDELADHLIDNGVTIPQWIPVTERLPEDDLPKGSTAKQIKVLVAYKRRNCSWVIRTQLRQKGRWYGRPNEWDWSVSDPISHWLPLPEPPAT